MSISQTANPCCTGRCSSLLAIQPDVMRAGPRASRPDLTLNVVYGALCIMAWIGTIVGFASELHHTETNLGFGTSSIKLSFSWNKISANDMSLSFADCAQAGSFIRMDQCDVCRQGGRGFVGCAVIAFLGLLLAIIFVMLRTLGKVKSSLLAEQVLSGVNVFFYLLMVLIWGGTCYQRSKDMVPIAGASNSTVGSGWGFCVFNLLLMILGYWLVYVIRRRSGDGGAHSDPLGSASASSPTAVTVGTGTHFLGSDGGSHETHGTTATTSVVTART